MKATISDIAKICGVSKGTINRAIHNKPGINVQTRDRIMHVVQEMDFHLDYFATSLATGITNTIGMIVPNVHNEFFAMLYTQIEQLCWEEGYMLNLALSDDNYQKEDKYLDSFLSRNVDGIILFPVGIHNPKLQLASSREIPIVAVLNDVTDAAVNKVSVDDYGSMKTTTENVIAAGHRRIAYLDGYTQYSDQYNSAINSARYAAYCDTLAEKGIPLDQTLYCEVESHYYDTDGRAMIDKLTGMEDPPTAIICFHDSIALWLCKALLKSGLRVPEDISLTGFDDVDELKLVTPHISTNRMPTKEIAQCTVKFLLEDIRNKTCSNNQIVLNTEFVPNSSIAYIKQTDGSKKGASTK